MWSILYWTTVCLFFLMAIFLLHIPLPPEIADRKKLQVLEILLRIGYEYPGDLIEYLFGPRIRNQYIRFLIAIGYIIPWPSPSHMKYIAGTSVRVYTPCEKRGRSALVFIHGGGWATMRAVYYDDLIGTFVKRLGVTVFSIDYRLAPEYPFPCPVDDCEAVVTGLFYINFNNRDQICIAGDSAGGNLAAVVVQRLSRRDEHFIKCQVLIYPVIHVFGFQLPSYLAYYEKYNGTSLLNPRAMARWILLYLGLPASRRNVERLIANQNPCDGWPHCRTSEKISEIKHQQDILFETFSTKGVNPDVSPLLGVRRDLPPAMVLTAEYDLLRDEGIQYVRKLQEEGVPCEWRHYKSAFHGICNMPYSLVRSDMSRDICCYLKNFI
ncbi:unnamed protein product [Angiostrongylus costaricensis]|uniref:Abhydrolase_3 domain-containing protein n=1 Tax=Angiostrongylus costaricensis TaxID=334426 RepID=A0A0R3PTA4_ANGCS|nr:unnamed protein product [Angiostrongylus costaricensis]